MEGVVKCFVKVGFEFVLCENVKVERENKPQLEFPHLTYKYITKKKEMFINNNVIDAVMLNRVSDELKCEDFFK